MLIPHLGDLLISGTDSLIAYLSGRLGNEYDVEVSDDNETIYSGVGIKEAPNEFAEDENIYDGTKTFTGSTLCSNNYEGGSGYFYSTSSCETKWRIVN